jgi:hypothetical protein
MKKPIIIFRCENCKDSKFFGIEEQTEELLLYKCRECGKIIAFKETDKGLEIQ